MKKQGAFKTHKKKQGMKNRTQTDLVQLNTIIVQLKNIKCCQRRNNFGLLANWFNVNLNWVECGIRYE